jgi:hypothetical protein
MFRFKHVHSRSAHRRRLPARCCKDSLDAADTAMVLQRRGVPALFAGNEGVVERGIGQ